jgi:hypothetical protein
VTAIILIGVAAAAVIALGLVFGGPIIGAILAGVIIIGGIVWLLAAGGSRTTATEAVQETDEQEFLGPGGPDDPSA